MSFSFEANRENKDNFDAGAAGSRSQANGKTFSWEKYVKEFPLEKLMTNYRKNVDTIRQAQQTATDLIRDLVQLNNQYMRQSFEDVSHYGRNAFPKAGSGSASASSGQWMETMQVAFDRSMAHAKQINDLFSQGASKVFNNYRQRFEEGVKEAESVTPKA